MKRYWVCYMGWNGDWEFLCDADNPLEARKEFIELVNASNSICKLFDSQENRPLLFADDKRIFLLTEMEFIS